MSEIVHLPACAFIGEKSEHVKRYRYRHFFYSLGLLAVLDVGMYELCCRHGFRYAIDAPGQNLSPVFLLCQQGFASRGRFGAGENRRRDDGGGPGDSRMNSRRIVQMDVYTSIRKYAYRTLVAAFPKDGTAQRKYLCGLQRYR